MEDFTTEIMKRSTANTLIPLIFISFISIDYNTKLMRVILTNRRDFELLDQPASLSTTNAYAYIEGSIMLLKEAKIVKFWRLEESLGVSFGRIPEEEEVISFTSLEKASAEELFEIYNK